MTERIKLVKIDKVALLLPLLAPVASQANVNKGISTARIARYPVLDKIPN
jgi:hypothetical protein